MPDLYIRRWRSEFSKIVGDSQTKKTTYGYQWGKERGRNKLGV